MCFRNTVKCLSREEKLVLFSAIAVHFWIALIPTQMVVINCQRWWEPFLSFSPYLRKHFVKHFAKTFSTKTLAFLPCFHSFSVFDRGVSLSGNIWPCDRGSCNTRVWEIVFLYWISSDIAFWYPLYPCMVVGIKIWKRKFPFVILHLSYHFDVIFIVFFVIFYVLCRFMPSFFFWLFRQFMFSCLNNLGKNFSCLFPNFLKTTSYYIYIDIFYTVINVLMGGWVEWILAFLQVM